jgi:hypothetical protein
MPDQPTLEPSLDAHQRHVLFLLIEDLPIWTIEDLGRAIDDPIGAADAVAGLRRSGLVCRTSDGHVFATRAASEAIALIGAVA